MLLIDLIFATLVAVLSGMGVGGGGLLVIYLTSFRNIPQITAQGINLFFFLFASASALFLHFSRRKINFSAIVLTSVTGVFGSLFGSALSSALDPSVVRRIFAYMLIFSGALALAKSIKKSLDLKRKK